MCQRLKDNIMHFFLYINILILNRIKNMPFCILSSWIPIESSDGISNALNISTHGLLMTPPASVGGQQTNSSQADEHQIPKNI